MKEEYIRTTSWNRFPQVTTGLGQTANVAIEPDDRWNRRDKDSMSARQFIVQVALLLGLRD